MKFYTVDLQKMADNFIVPKTCSSKIFRKDLKFVVCSKLKRNKRRILRRKRSRLRYFNNRKERRLNRNWNDLSDTVSVINLTDMEYQNNSLIEPLPEVAEWHKQQQIAYWKSRALALECENHMLYRHIENMYSKQIQDYVDYEQNEPEEVTQRLKEKHKKAETAKKIWKAPEVNFRKAKSEEMKNLYGEMAPKIAGMETAIQLNYDLYLEKHDAKLWPNIPLRL